jgi:protein TonB
MLQFTYAPQRSAGPRVVLCVAALHALALSLFLWSPQAPLMHTPSGITLEMVLTPLSLAPPQPHTQRVVAQTSASKPNAAPAETPAAAAPTPPSTAPRADITSVTTSAAPAVASSRSGGAPALVLPTTDAQGLNNPKPAYPRLSRRLNEQGQVVVRVFVTAEGLAQQGDIKTSSGYDRLDQEALRTVLHWRFVPGQRLGVPEAMWFNVPVNFVLD